MLKENRKLKGRSEIKEKGARPQPRPGPRPPDRPSPPTTAPGSPLLHVPPTGVATGASPVGPVHRRRQGDKVPGSLFLPCSTHSPRLPSLASQIHALFPSLSRSPASPERHRRRPPSSLRPPSTPSLGCTSTSSAGVDSFERWPQLGLGGAAAPDPLRPLLRPPRNSVDLPRLLLLLN